MTALRSGKKLLKIRIFHRCSIRFRRISSNFERIVRSRQRVSVLTFNFKENMKSIEEGGGGNLFITSVYSA